MKIKFPCGHGPVAEVALANAWETWQVDDAGELATQTDSGHDEETWTCKECGEPVDVGD